MRRFSFLASCRRFYTSAASQTWRCLRFFLPQGLLAILLMLSGCSSPLKQGAYVPIIDLPPIQSVGEAHEPEVIKYDNIPTLDQWVKKYTKEGWVVIGGATWVCVDDPLVRESESGFKNKGREVGADLVLWANHPAGRTQTTYVPMGVPNAPAATATPYGVIQNPSAPTVYNVPINFHQIEQKGIFLVRPERICLRQADLEAGSAQERGDDKCI